MRSVLSVTVFISLGLEICCFYGNAINTITDTQANMCYMCFFLNRLDSNRKREVNILLIYWLVIKSWSITPGHYWSGSYHSSLSCFISQLFFSTKGIQACKLYVYCYYLSLMSLSAIIWCFYIYE